MASALQCHFIDGNFIHTCKDVDLIFDKKGAPLLQATCGNGKGDGSFSSSGLRLDDHIQNDNGRMVCRRCGGFARIGDSPCNFSHTCRVIQLQPGGTILTATCDNIHQFHNASSIDLNNCIVNARGVLDWKCGGQL